MLSVNEMLAFLKRETTTSYQTVRSDDIEESPNTSVLDVSSEQRTSRRHPKTLIISLLVCAFATVANIFLAFSTSPQVPRGSPDGLRRPSTYYNLSRLVDEVSEPQYNFPLVLAQVSSVQPDKVFFGDPHAYDSFRGYISPRETELLVTSDVSTIVQFRMHSYGVERCVFVVSVPTANNVSVGEVDNTTHLFVPGGYELHGDTGAVELWKLQSSSNPLDPQRLTYRNKPKREYMLASMNILVGEDTRTREFFCGENTLQTFEMVCPWTNCRIHWWQEKGNESLGAMVLQLPTIAPADKVALESEGHVH